MARAPDPKAAQAKEMFLAGKKLIEISAALDVPEGTVRSWKNRYGWANATLQKPKRNVARKRGGQPGNKNAVGHGGTGPPGNKNAVTTGEFEALLFDCLDPEERSRLRSADRIPAKSRYYGGVEQLEARRVHAPKAAGSNPAPAIEHKKEKHLSHPGRRRIAGVLFGMIRNGR